MRRAYEPTTLGELAEAVTRAAEDGSETATDAHEMAMRALVDSLVHAGRADLIEQLVELAGELEESEADVRRERPAGAGAEAAA
jgi:hypothetical protein